MKATLLTSQAPAFGLPRTTKPPHSCVLLSALTVFLFCSPSMPQTEQRFSLYFWLSWNSQKSAFLCFFALNKVALL